VSVWNISRKVFKELSLKEDFRVCKTSGKKPNPAGGASFLIAE
jgi:hypothetical protein